MKRRTHLSVVTWIAALWMLGVLQACATSNVAGRSTVNLTTPGIAALHASEVVKVLDVIRDTAVDAEAVKLMPTATAKAVVTWHNAALETIKATPNGWKATVLAGLDALLKGLAPAERQILAPYIAAAEMTIKAVI